MDRLTMAYVTEHNGVDIKKSTVQIYSGATLR